MIDQRNKNPTTLYIKKKVMMTRNSNLMTESDLSIQSTPIDVIIEEKTCTANESEVSPQELKKQHDVNESTMDRIRSFGEREQFRAIVKGLMKKRTDKTYNKGRFKPELYNRDFIFYFNQHKFVIMLKRGEFKVSLYLKSANSLPSFSPNVPNQSFGETPIEHSNILTSTLINLNLSSNNKKSSNPHSPNVSKVLTKIPNKLVGDNKRLDYAYTKAKDAARVVRRLEYSYNMKIGQFYSKPYHRSNAQVIQKWWRKTIKEKTETPNALTIQKIFRGKLTRVAFKETLRFIQYLPFLSILHSLLFDKLNQTAFDDLLFKFGMKTLNSIVIPKADLIVRRVKSYLTNRLPVIPKVYQMKCVLNKFIYDCHSSHVINKLQGRIKIYLMKHNNRIMLYYAGKIHPYLYYYLKYGTQMYKKKIVSFRRSYLRLREFNLQVNKGLENRFELLPFLMRKMYWKIFNQYNNDAKKKDNNKPIKKRLMRKYFKYNDKKNLRSALGHLKLYNKVHKRFIKPHNGIVLKMLCTILQSKVNLLSFAFISQLKAFTFNRHTKNEAMKNVLAIKQNITPDALKYANKYFQLWRKNAARVVLTKSSRKLNRFFSSTKKKFKKSKAIKHFYLNGLIQTATLFNKASFINMKLRNNISKSFLLKLGSNRKMQIIESLLKSMRNSPKLVFLRWKLENKKYKRGMKAYITLLKKRKLTQKKQAILLSINIQLKTRLVNHHLRKAFLRYMNKAGVYYRYQHCFTFQLLFFNKKKKQISSIKYRLLRYTVNKITVGQEDLRINNRLIEKWDLWKEMIKGYRLKKFIKRNCKRIIRFKAFLTRSRMMHWKKLTKLSSKTKVQTQTQIQVKVKTKTKMKA